MRQLRSGGTPGDRPGADASDPDAPESRLPPGLTFASGVEKLPSWAPVALLVLAGIVVHFPAVDSLFYLDDFLHRSMLEGTFPGERSPLDLYAFVDDSNRDELLERGLLPWWTHPNLQVRFFRPLSSALVAFDHWVLGGAPLPMHLHSLGWWLVAVLAVRALHRQLFSRRVAWIATLIFALSPCHALPLSWIANRDALLSLSFGVIGLGAHVRFVRTSSLRDALLAAGGFGLALGAGEYGLSMFAYVLAIALVDRKTAVVARLRAMLTFVVPASVYLGVRAAWHYGTRGSGFYSDPFHDPAIFLWLAPRRVATLLATEWMVLEPETITWDHPTWALALLVALIAALVLVALRESFATLDEERRTTTSWMLAGSVFALAPVLAVVPAPRVLGASMIGLGATVAIVIDGAWFRPTPRRPGIAREIAALVAIGLAFAQLVRGPGEAWLEGRRYRSGSVRFASQVDTFAELAPAMRESDVVVVRALAGAFFIPFAVGHDELPRRHRLLAESPHVLMRRTDERAVELFSAFEGSLFVAGEGCLFRDLRSPFAEGDVIHASGLDVEILRVTEGRVTGARFTLDAPLEALTLVNETRTIFEPVAIPPVGFGAPLDAGPTPED